MSKKNLEDTLDTSNQDIKNFYNETNQMLNKQI